LKNIQEGRRVNKRKVKDDRWKKKHEENIKRYRRERRQRMLGKEKYEEQHVGRGGK
jgi:hypothetical protein